MSDRYESLRLRNQLCFPVYLCAKEIVNRYAKPLGELDLSYTQYVIMMFLWENGETTAKHISDALLLDQSTLTPLLRKLEAKGYIARERCTDDERCVRITLTEAGRKLEERALSVPEQMRCCIGIEREEAEALLTVIMKIIKNIRSEQENGSDQSN